MKLQELLADPAVDVVCVASLDHLHMPHALAAIRAGEDVLQGAHGPLEPT